MRDSPREELAVTGSGSLSAAQMLIILCEEKRGSRARSMYKKFGIYVSIVYYITGITTNIKSETIPTCG
jgi:hypothetical protein